MGRMHVHVRLLACVWLVVGRLLAGVWLVVGRLLAWVLLVVWRRLAWVLMVVWQLLTWVWLVRLLTRVLLLVLGRLLTRLLARDRLALHHLSLVGAWLLWVALLRITLLRITLLRITLLTVAALHRLTLTWSELSVPCGASCASASAPCETEGKSRGLLSLFSFRYQTPHARGPPLPQHSASQLACMSLSVSR